MVLPAVTRALADAFSNKIDHMVQQWQRQATQRVEATLQDPTKSTKPLASFCYVPTGPRGTAGDPPRVVGAPGSQRESKRPQPDGPRPRPQPQPQP